MNGQPVRKHIVEKTLGISKKEVMELCSKKKSFATSKVYQGRSNRFWSPTRVWRMHGKLEPHYFIRFWWPPPLIKEQRLHLGSGALLWLDQCFWSKEISRWMLLLPFLASWWKLSRLSRYVVLIEISCYQWDVSECICPLSLYFDTKLTEWISCSHCTSSNYYLMTIS